MHQLTRLAKRAAEKYIMDREVIGVPDDIEPEYRDKKAGVFVCLKSGDQLRGCIGTFIPLTGNIAEETVRNAIAAATEDPRFPRVSAYELDTMRYTVDVLSAPEEVQDVRGLDPKKYGIIVVKDNRKGLLLPDLEGVDTAEEQIRIAKMKAGIMPHENVKIFRFYVERYT
jgi:AmmeMemoRadiSam system protein A